MVRQSTVESCSIRLRRWQAMWPYMFSDKEFTVAVLAQNEFQIWKIWVWIFRSFEVDFLIFVGGAGGGAPVWDTRQNWMLQGIHKNDRIALQLGSNEMILITYSIVRTTFCDLSPILELQYTTYCNRSSKLPVFLRIILFRPWGSLFVFTACFYLLPFPR